MSRMFHRRRAERFAQLLDEAEGGRRHHLWSDIDAELAPAVAIGRRLGQVGPAAEPRRLQAQLDPDFRTSLRAMLVATAVRDGIGVTAAAPEPEARPAGLADRLTRPPAGPRTTAGPAPVRRARTRAAVIIGVAAGTLALSGMSAASGDALPGDPLYSVKRSTERAQLALASSDMSRGQLYLAFARTRLTEAQASRLGAAELIDVLNDMDSETRQGVRLLSSSAVDRRDPAALDWVDTFVGRQQQDIGLILDSARGDAVRGDARDRATRSRALLDLIGQRIGLLRKSLSCGNAGNGMDALGPVPAPCAAAAPRAGQPAGDTSTSPRSGAAPPASADGTGTPVAEKPDGLLGDLGRLLGGLLSP